MLLSSYSASAQIPERPVACVPATPGVEGASAAARAGAVGCLAKDIDPRRLPQVVGAVAVGQAAFPRRLLPALFASGQAGRPERLGI